MSLIGKVVKHNFQGFLVLEELDEAYAGFWVSGTHKAEPEEIPKDVLGEPDVLADSMDAFVARSSDRAVAKAMASKYIGTVCMNSNSTLGIVTDVKDGTCLGVTFDGGEWSSQRPEIVARHLVDYLNKKVRERVEKI
jgi:hypothetical protein